MKTILFLLITNLFPLIAYSQISSSPVENFKNSASLVDINEIKTLPVHHNGRVKPFDTFARESILFISGNYKFKGLHPTQSYISLIISPSNKKIEIINIRNTSLREQLGFAKKKRHVSINQLDASPLLEFAKPILEKESKNKRSLEPQEKDLLEVYSQYWLVNNIISGSHLLSAMDIASLMTKTSQHSTSPHSIAGTEVLTAGRKYLNDLANEDVAKAKQSLIDLKLKVRSQKVPDLFKSHLNNIDLEVFYNNSHLFFISALMIFLLGLALFFKKPRSFLTHKYFRLLFILPFVPLITGFALRVIITGFAPVTNMYGTMIWVAFGIALFSLVLLFLYKNYMVVGFLWIASSGFLFLTENMPLILSPDMDPIVAVLRSNLWLTIHVLTIVISYAALSITMVLGNIVLIRSIITGFTNDSFVKDYAKFNYRMIQLGVFLLSVGIILGGIWADYSWGRFWGWDPKETWALIADLGYIIILHARYAGYVSPFMFAVLSPIAFLLVIMAWYGVNFILAAGLHSYGFSAGGTTLVLTFVAVQLVIVAIALVKAYLIKKK